MGPVYAIRVINRADLNGGHPHPMSAPLECKQIGESMQITY